MFNRKTLPNRKRLLLTLKWRGILKRM